MAVLRIQGFSGRIPATGDRALPDNFAVDAMNTWLYGQELRGMRPPTDVIAIGSGTREVLRVPKRTIGGDPAFPTVIPPPSYLGDSVWLQFQDPNTDILKGQLIEDQFERYYFCSPTVGPMFNTYARLVAGQTPFKLGVVAPTPGTADAPVVGTVTGGAAPVVTRAYVYTWANEFGEESAPSWPDTGSGNANGTWPITNIKAPPTLGADYPAYTKKFLYRTITGASGQTTYYRVTEIPLATTTYSDDGATMTDAILAGNLMLASTSWAMPPEDLQGWIAMPNGFLIGFDKPDPVTKAGGNNIYMSEAYHWHAWPAEYKQATETPVVGLGVIGTTCVVCTEGYPTAIIGSTPATCSFTKSTTGEPCLSRGSIVSTPTGVIYASQNGLISVGSEGIVNVTQQMITKDDWRTQYTPDRLRAVRYLNGYLALQDIPGASNNRGFFVDPSALKVALTEFTNFDDVLNFNNDFWSGEVFAIKSGQIMLWDPDGSDDLMPVRWLSKEFQYSFQENFGAYAIYWDQKRFDDAAAAGGNLYDPDLIPSDEEVRFKAYANRQVVYDQKVPLNGRGVRLPSGFKSDIWQFEIRARAPVYSLHVASTMKELKGV